VTRIRQLDGLRALAVMAVIQQHWGAAAVNQAIGPGGLGVNCFFVLSGFLITGILLRARTGGDPGEALRTFYIRRALRIFPAYYLVLVLGSLVSRHVSDDWLWHVFYLSNVRLAIDREWPGAAAHLWSLSVEEQFYLVWPAVVLFTARRWLELLMLAIVAAAPIWRGLILTATGGNDFAAANLLPGASDCLAMGAWLACRRERTSSPLPPYVVYAGVLLWLAGRVGSDLVPGWRLGLLAGSTASALIFVGLVDHIVRNGSGTRWLAWRPLVHVGVVSYGVYLFHNFVPAFADAVSPDLASWMYAHGAGPFVTVAALSVGLATISWIVVERPLNELKDRVPLQDRADRQAGPAELSLPRATGPHVTAL